MRIRRPPALNLKKKKEKKKKQKKREATPRSQWLKRVLRSITSAFSSNCSSAR